MVFLYHEIPSQLNICVSRKELPGTQLRKKRQGPTLASLGALNLLWKELALTFTPGEQGLWQGKRVQEDPRASSQTEEQIYLEQTVITDITFKSIKNSVLPLINILLEQQQHTLKTVFINIFKIVNLVYNVWNMNLTSLHESPRRVHDPAIGNHQSVFLLKHTTAAKCLRDFQKWPFSEVGIQMLFNLRDFRRPALDFYLSKIL